MDIGIKTQPVETQEKWISRYSWLKHKRQFQLQSMIWPGIILLLIFNYRTMYWLILAFKDYDVITGFKESPWVGFKFFKELFTDPNMVRAV